MAFPARGGAGRRTVRLRPASLKVAPTVRGAGAGNHLDTRRVIRDVKRIRSLLRRALAPRALGVLLAASAAFALSYAAFETRVARAFEAATASAPTRVYARPIILRPGDRPSRERVESQLRRVGYRRTTGRVPATGRYRLDASEWRIGRRPLRLGSFFEPGGPVRIRLDRSGRIRDIRDDRDLQLAGIALDPDRVAAFPGPGGRDRVPVRLDQVPRHLIDALVATEDRRFLDHNGLDPRRIVGAMVANLRQGRLAQGGSTLTQQLARTLFLGTRRSLLRKVREVAIAFALERRFDKPRLLEAYLNHIYLGQDGADAIHGVGRAAEFFFDEDVSELDVGESAMLVGIIRGPSLYSPHRHLERARARRDLVLRLMNEEGLLAGDALERALAADLDIAPPPPGSGGARWYLDHLRGELASSGLDPDGAGLTVISTLEPSAQAAAERVVSRRLAALERMRPRLARQEAPLQAALVAIDPWTGEIIAMVGGRSYAASQYNRATTAHRQPGSAFKPIVALAALTGDEEHRYTLASTLADEPLRVDTPAGVWNPSNADARFLGPVTLRRALETSRNVPFARLGMAIGPARIVETARRLGIRSPLVPVPALALGASEVSLLELTSAYAALAAEGLRTSPHSVRSVLDPNGDRLGDTEPSEAERVFTPAETYLLTSALRGVVEEGTGTTVRELGYRGPVAAKSGTTNGSRDAWFVGYTPEMAVGVWVGFDDGTPLGLSGSQAALPIFTGFLLETLGPDGGAEFRFPDGLEWVEVPREAADRRGRRCEGEPELFLAGTEPSDACSRWRRGWRGPSADGEGLLEDAARWLRERARALRRGARVESGGPGR